VRAGHPGIVDDEPVAVAPDAELSPHPHAQRRLARLADLDDRPVHRPSRRSPRLDGTGAGHASPVAQGGIVTHWMSLAYLEFELTAKTRKHSLAPGVNPLITATVEFGPTDTVAVLLTPWTTS